jgi:alpha-beta hydrolase superfamily lysophospholipase
VAQRRRHQPVDYTSQTVNHLESPLTTPSGIQLSRRDWRPDGRPAAVLAMVHGYGEHGGRYSPLAEALVAFGYALSTFDLRGHGHSQGRRGHIDRFADYESDVRLLTATLHREYPGCPVFLLGHSLGGLIAARCAETDDSGLAGLILASPFLRLALPVSSAKIAAAKLLSRIAPARDIGNTLPPEKLSHDPRIVQAYRDDKLIHRAATARWAAEVLVAQKEALDAAASLRLPLFLQYATADAIADQGASLELFAAARSTDKTCQGYENYFHEIYNETGRAAVFADLIDWLELRRHASGAPRRPL